MCGLGGREDRNFPVNRLSSSCWTIFMLDCWRGGNVLEIKIEHFKWRYISLYPPSHPMTLCDWSLFEGCSGSAPFWEVSLLPSCGRQSSAPSSPSDTPQLPKNTLLRLLPPPRNFFSSNTDDLDRKRQVFASLSWHSTFATNTTMQSHHGAVASG